ncbi:MAG: hypothetical protein ACI9VS_001052 [Candidatus Binatia bacterium]|jgi:hypothetical protein
MTTQAIARQNDALPDGATIPQTLDLPPLLGEWRNTNPNTGEIARLTVQLVDGQLSLEIFGAGADGLIPWGTAPILVYAASMTSDQVLGMESRYDFGFMVSLLALNYAKGVLVIQSYNRFNDDSGRPNYFTREFFHQ